MPNKATTKKESITIHERLAYAISSLCLLQLLPSEKSKNYMSLQVNIRARKQK